MKEGDLIVFHNSPSLTAIIIKGPQHKRHWGASGHPEDVEIVAIVEILRTGSGWKELRGKKKYMRLDHLTQIAEVVSDQNIN